MAGTPGTEFHEKLSDMTECSICAETFTNPKTLPCIHTFCLHCLEEYGKDKTPGDRMACPICRHEFVIPSEGFSNLPNNFFIGKIVEIGKLASGSAKEPVCDLCIEEAAPAKKFCIDCEQKLCDRCSTSHTRIKHCQNHQIVELGSQLNIQELNIHNSYCEHHPKELIKMYCYEDNVAVCVLCCVENHRSHRCVNVDKAAGELKEQMKDDVGKVANRRPECEEACQKLKKFKTEFAQEVVKTEESIRKSGIELKKEIDQHTEMLIQNLRETRDRNLKCFETAKQEVNRFKVMIDSYQRYCKELLARGSPVDICRAARQMHKRSRDLEQLFENCSVGDFCYETITFHSAQFETPMKQSGFNNIVGEVTVAKIAERIANFQKSTCTSEIDYPVNWQTMKNDEDFKCIQLKTSEPEYKNVAKAVFSTALTTVNQIFKIERIQNKLLYRQYVLRKAAMDADNPELQNERTLWHGASADARETINQTGFFGNGKSEDAAMCQSGVYFAKNFSFAAQKEYAKPDANGFKHIYQCKVLIGKCAIGKSSRSMTVPRSEPRTPIANFDSTVDNMINPTTFVICYSNQAYPEYLIYFK